MEGGWLILGELDAAAPAACFQRGPRIAALFALASPTRPEEGASRTCLCIRWGRRGLRAIQQVRFGVSSPSPSKVCSPCKFPFCFFIPELMCGILPAQQSFLGFDCSPQTCFVKLAAPC